MKHLFCLLALLLFLTGCASETNNETSTNPPVTKKESVSIELTPENFYDYFEVTMKTNESYNSYDELAQVIVFYSLNLKEDILNDVTALKLKAFDYKAINPSACTFIYDLTTQTFQISDFNADLAAQLDFTEEKLMKEWIAEDDTNDMGFDLNSFKNDYFNYVTINKTPPWTTIDTGVIEGNLYKTVGIQYDGFEITRVNGEITVNK